MTIEDTVFQKVKISHKKMASFGFHGSPEGAYIYETDFCEDQYAKLLKDIAVHIGIPVPFQSDQANRLTMEILKRGGTELV